MRVLRAERLRSKNRAKTCQHHLVVMTPTWHHPEPLPKEVDRLRMSQ